MNIPSTLLEAISQKKVVLFAGAGVSMNLNLPSWGKLIEQIAAELCIEHELFEQQGNFLELAEFFEIQKGSINPLVDWMKKNFLVSDGVIKASEVHELIVQLDFEKIYTTNYDNCIERAHDLFFKNYIKIAGPQDFHEIRQGVTQIIKYHGDLSDVNSIVLTESSYFDRLSLNHPLDLKLQSDTLGRSILFIGYSLSDIDVRYLLNRIQKQWNGKIEDLHIPKSYVLLSKVTEVQKNILESRNIEVIHDNSFPPGEELAVFLRKLVNQS